MDLSELEGELANCQACPLRQDAIAPVGWYGNPESPIVFVANEHIFCTRIPAELQQILRCVGILGQIAFHNNIAWQHFAIFVKHKTLDIRYIGQFFQAVGSIYPNRNHWLLRYFSIRNRLPQGIAGCRQYPGCG